MVNTERITGEHCSTEEKSYGEAMTVTSEKINELVSQTMLKVLQQHPLLSPSGAPIPSPKDPSPQRKISLPLGGGIHIMNFLNKEATFLDEDSHESRVGTTWLDYKGKMITAKEVSIT